MNSKNYIQSQRWRFSYSCYNPRKGRLSEKKKNWWIAFVL